MAEDDQTAIKDVLALSESMVAKERQEGVIDVLANPEVLERFTNLKRSDPIRYAKLMYLLADTLAIEKWERDGGTYQAPDMDHYLVIPDLNLRTSEQGFLTKVFKSISHLTEGSGGGGKVGWFGRRKG